MKRLIVGIAATALVAASLVMSGTPASARGVSINSEGLSLLRTYTWRESNQSSVTFTISDRQGLARQVSLCLVTPSYRRINCDTLALRESKYRDGTWRVRQTSTGWEVRARVGGYQSTAEECLSNFDGRDYGLELGALNSRGRVLGEALHEFRMVCQGYAAQSTGGDRIRLRVGADSERLRVRFAILDQEHMLKNIRQCFYNVDEEETGRCWNYDLKRSIKRTKRGWETVDSLYFSSVNASQCRWIGRNEPHYQWRVTLYDRYGDAVGTYAHDFWLDC